MWKFFKKKIRNSLIIIVLRTEFKDLKTKIYFRLRLLHLHRPHRAERHASCEAAQRSIMKRKNQHLDTRMRRKFEKKQAVAGYLENLKLFY